MTRAALVWSEGGSLRCAAVPEERECVVGRSQDATVLVSDITVSRRQACLRSENGAFVIEQLSAQNPTRVNGQLLETPRVLTDKAVIQMGAVQLVFHDLQATEQTVVRQPCGFCKRNNPVGRTECWYCGTNLANAPTVWIGRRTSRCRLVAAAGESFDLFDDEVYAFRVRGPAVAKIEAAPPSDALATVEVKERRPQLGPALSPGVSVNGAPAAAGQALHNGDLLQAGPHKLLVIVR